jgi:hypothetical protein
MTKSPIRGMTQRAFEDWLAEQVTPRLPGPFDWQATTFGAAIRPSTWFARGLCISGTSRTRFRAHGFVVPLFRPVEEVYFNHAVELDAPGQRYFDPPSDVADSVRAEQVVTAFTENAMPHITTTGELRGFAARLIHKQKVTADRGSAAIPYAEEAGHCLLILGDEIAARTQLTLASAALPADAPVWDIERSDRALEILALLDQDATPALRRLAEWAENSATNLGVDWVPPCEQ